MRFAFKNKWLEAACSSGHFVPADFRFDDWPEPLISPKPVLTLETAEYAANKPATVNEWRNIDRVRLIYCGNEAYFFQIEIEEQAMHFVMSPGQFRNEEHSATNSRNEILTSSASWAERVHEELIATPLYRRFEEQRTVVDQLTSRYADLEEDVQFTRDEVRTIREELEELRRHYYEHVNEQESSDTAKEERLTSFDADIEFLKTTVESTNKSRFARNLFARWAKWVTDPENRPLIESTARVGEFLLTEGAKRTQGGD